MENEDWEQHKKDRRKKRWQNNDQSMRLLENSGIDYEILNASLGHYRVGDFDFWATTGKFYNQKTKEKGRGVFNLIKKIENAR